MKREHRRPGAHLPNLAHGPSQTSRLCLDLISHNVFINQSQKVNSPTKPSTLCFLALTKTLS